MAEQLNVLEDDQNFLHNQDDYVFSDEDSDDEAARAVVLDAQVIIDGYENEVLQDIWELNVENGVHGRIKNFYEQVIPSYTDDKFHEHFRMHRRTFNELDNVIRAEITDNRLNYIPLTKKVYLALWLLANQETFRSVADRFDMTKSEAWYCFCQVIYCLRALLPRFVNWPTPEECAESERVFRMKSRGFPGVVGAIDGCHIPIKQPPGNAHDYYNRKDFHSILLQGICDHRGLFIDCLIGRPGRAHDAAVFRSSPIYERLVDEQYPILPPHQHIIGDSAYPLLLNVMTPFREDRNITPQRIMYNNKLSSIRSIIERTFALLKGKWRRLKYLDVHSTEMANTIIAAACTLHNFLVLHGEINFDDRRRPPNEMGNIDENRANGDNQNLHFQEEKAKRFHIMNSL